MADAGIIRTDWSGFCTPGGHGPVAMALGHGITNGVHIFGNSIIVEPGCTASISWSGRWHPFQLHPPSIGAVTMELVDDQGKVWASNTGNVTSKSQYSSIGGGAEAVPGRLPLGTSYRLMATVQDGTMCPPDDPKGKLIIDARGRPALKPATRGGPHLPSDATSVRIKHKVHTRAMRFGLKIRKWPKKRGKKATPAQQRARDDFKQMVTLVQQVPSWDRGAAQAIAHNSGWTYRDVLSKAVTGTLWSVPGMQSAALPFILDALSSVEGAILYRGPDGWVGMAPGADGDVIVYHAGLPTIASPASLGLGITELHGEVIAGPGSGNQAASLSATGVVAGVYQSADIAVDSHGRIIGASGGAIATTSSVGLSKPDGTTITIDGTGKLAAPNTAITAITGDITTTAGPGAVVATAANSGVTPGTYSFATVTLDAKGRATSAAAGAAATLATLGLVKPDGTSVIIDGTGKISAVGGGGGGTGLFSGAGLFVPLSANYTHVGWSGTTIASFASDSALFYETATNSGEQARLLLRAVQTTPFKHKILCIPIVQRDEFHRVGIGLYDGTKLEGMVMNSQAGSPAISGGQWSTLTSLTGGFGATVNLSDAGNEIWFAVANDGTTSYYEWGFDGENWITFYSRANAGGFLASSTRPCIIIEALNNASGRIYGIDILSDTIVASAP